MLAIKANRTGIELAVSKRCIIVTHAITHKDTIAYWHDINIYIAILLAVYNVTKSLLPIMTLLRWLIYVILSKSNK